MAAPPLDPSVPLSAASHSLTNLTDTEGRLNAPSFQALVRQALHLVRSGRTWPRSKTFKLEHDIEVDATKGASSCSGRLAKCGWHARRSIHSPSHSHGLNFHDFREGLAVDHAVKEQQYIHDIILTDSLGKLKPPKTLDCNNTIKECRIEMFHTGYNLPALTGNRDFSQMFLTLEFIPVADPLSDAHIDEILASFDTPQSQERLVGVSDEQNRLSSFVNIQLPVKHSECPEVTKEYVRAYYASVEMVRQTKDDGAEWWMAVQSDSSGRIPLMFQEMAMPSKVAPDVPLFIGWAAKNKA